MSEDEVRWLDDVESAGWLPLMATTMWLPTALDMQLQRDSGLSHVEYGVLSSLSQTEDRTMKLSELARFANSTLSRLSKIMNRCFEQGWVERHPDPEDGRTTLATLTDAGMEKVIATAPGHVARVRELVFDNLTATEKKQLATIAAKIATAIGPDGACASRVR